MTDTITFLPCPFCGCGSDFVIGCHGDGRMTYTVFCDGCHASGATEFSRHCARRNWNRRCRDSDGSSEAGETQSGSTEGDSAAIAQTKAPQS